jgi:hypothetical protein
MASLLPFERFSVGGTNPINVCNFVLDPLSTIVKLAILAHKPPQTKLCIYNNVLYFQEPGPFQGVCRMFYNNQKTDLHYIYNPIQLACERYLGKPEEGAATAATASPVAPSASGSAGAPNHKSKGKDRATGTAGEREATAKDKERDDLPRLKQLFRQAQKGLQSLMETYKGNVTLRHSLYYYSLLIANHVEEKFDPDLFRGDSMTMLYSEPVVTSLHQQWNSSWLTMVLDMIGFLGSDSVSPENIRLLETLMLSVDVSTRAVLTSA